MKKLIYSILLLCAFTSCELLEQEPKTQILTENFYQTEEDALTAVNSTYAQLKSGTSYYSQVYVLNLFASSDQGLANWKYSDYHRGILTGTDPTLRVVWEAMYKAIRDANNVIYHVPNIAMDEELKSRIIGEARFLRALNYFNLVRCFGEVPLRTMPLRPEATQYGTALSPIKDIYATIILDLKYASENCWGLGERRGAATNEIGRVTNAAADALLAKVYLRLASATRTAVLGNEGNERYAVYGSQYHSFYDSAKVYCDKVIENTDYTLVTNVTEWKEIFAPTKGNNRELIFDVQSDNIVGLGSGLANIFSPKNAGFSAGGWGGESFMIPGFVNTSIDKYDPRYVNGIIQEFTDDKRDVALDMGTLDLYRGINLTNQKNLSVKGIYTMKYIDPDATSEHSSQQNWHVVRLADVYLMRAEALAEIHKNPATANDDINALRQRVGHTPFDGAGMSMTDFREAMLKERGVELFVEGHRWFDLTRMGVYESYVKATYSHAANKVNVQNFGGVRGPEDYTWPIPVSESEANNLID